MDNDLSDIKLVDIITDAINRKEGSVLLLLSHPLMMSMLDEASDRLARKFKLDRNEVRDAISEKVREKIDSIENRNQQDLSKVLAAWCRKAGLRWCINKTKHNQVQVRYCERVIRENTRGKRRSVDGNAKPLQFPTAGSPEDILLDKEQLAFLKGLPSELVKIVATLPPEDIHMIVLWSSGKTLVEIHEATGIALSTVGKHLKKSQNLIIKRIGLQRIIDLNSEKRKAELLKRASRFIRNSLKEIGYFENFPPRAA